MNKKTLVELVLAGTFILLPQTITNSSGSLYTHKNIPIEKTLTPLERAGLEIYTENQQALGTNFFEFYRLVYSDIEDTANPTGYETLEQKTAEELKKGQILRDTLEKRYERYITALEITLDKDTKWGRFIDGEQIIPRGTYVKRYHEAIDIFTEEGNRVLAPFDGLIIASGDEWEGKFHKRTITEWNNKGLTPKAGNAIIIYNPIEKGYMLISHFEEGILVRAGDIVQKGQTIGCVGNSGSASIPGHGEHIHVAYKLPDKEGYLRGINFSERIK
jgi:murein DD-endopeptidase MepM/ murein hydrolase activator NlpD